jgi:hypothetical protein
LIRLGNVIVLKETFNERKSARFEAGERDILLVTMQVSSLSSVVGRTCGVISFALVVGTLF